METITLKVHGELLHELDSYIIPDYGTRSDFIRQAIREKIEKERKERLLLNFETYFGKGSKKTTDSQLRAIREHIREKK